MGNGNYVQTSFLGGEWSPLAQGRMDDPRYKTALATCLNSLPLEEGAWTRRPGFHLGGYTRLGAEAKLMPFEVQETDPYDLELTAGHLRVWSGRNLVSDTEADVSTISSASPAAVTIGAAQTSWATGDHVFFRFTTKAAALACARLTNRVFQITKTSTMVFTLSDPITGQNFDGSLVSYPGSGAVMARVLDITTPFTTDLFKTVRAVQSEEDAILLQSTVKPQVLTLSNPGESSASFALNPSAFLDGPYLDAVSGTTATPSATTGIISVTLGFQAYSAAKAYKKGDYVTSVGVGYRSIADANVGHTPATSPTYWTTAGFGEPVGPNGFVNTDIGRLIRLFSGGSAWTWGRVTGQSTTGFVDPSTLTKIGDMTQNGGIAAAFDGDYSKAYADAATLRGVNNCYVGLDLGAGTTTVRSVVVYPLDGAAGANGFWGSNVNSTKVSLHLYGKTGATPPSNSTDGTLLGSVVAPNVLNEPITVNSSDTATAFDYIWVRMHISGTGENLSLSQLQFFNASGSPGSTVTVEILGPDLVNTTACAYRIGAYSDTTGWPTCGCYTEGRLWLGGAVDNRFDSSNSNDIYNFAPTNAAGAVGDANAISYTVNADDVNPIFWMEPNAQGIVMGTQGGEWLVSGSTDNNTMTPTTIKARRVTKYKCANTPPVVVGLSTVFVQKAKRNVLEFISDIFSGKFFAPNLNELARHMTKTGLEEICGQDGLTPIVWGRRADGVLVGATYKRISMHSSEPPKFLGWHRHELGSGFDVTSISRSGSDDGLSETLSIVTQDDDGYYHVEQLSTFLNEEAELTNAVFLDHAVVPSCGDVVTIGTSDYIRLYGLDNLEGSTVTAFVAGVDCGEFTVSSGKIDVPFGTGDLTVARLQELTSVDDETYGDLEVSIADKYLIPAVVGSTYNSDAQQLRPYRMEDTGARAGVAFGKAKRSHEFAMLVDRTQGLSVGTSFDRLRNVIFRSPGNRQYGRTELYSGIINDLLDDGYSTDSMVCWRVTRPYPATVLASGAFLQTQDK